MSGLGSAEAQEQERDWARLGLASHLGMDTAQLRDATYDTLPVRDPGFAGLAQQDIGPGRYLYDGHGGLHVLVPRGDPHAARTIGLQLDQYRTDAGADAPQTQVHYYQVDAATGTIDLTAGPAEPTSQVRAANGYVTMAVGTAAELSRFLARTSYLSRLQLRGSKLWANGWDWPANEDARLTMADVSALRRGYTDARRTGGQLPGFSLDPQRVTTVADLLAVIPGLSQDLANRIVTNDWAGSAFTSATDLDTQVVNPALFGDVSAATLSQDGLPTDRTQLWALDAQLVGRSPYSQARYDGELAGTQVGMTLFYTDYVAKTWVTGAATGIPSEAATGFAPDTTAPTVWSECNNQPMNESGRLWFGENDSAVRSDANGISIGAQSTRLYSREDGPHGSEVEPTYSFGRALLWWDQHYQAMADYDPEYQRLDQIMRWSDAIDWLVSKTSATLPRMSDQQIPSKLTFADWYHKHNELRERSPIDFLSPPGADLKRGTWPTSYGESVAHPPSKTFMDCGQPVVEGGISLGNSSDREGDINYHPDLPASVSRAGTYEHASAFHDKTGTGDIKEVSLDDSGKVASFLEHRFSASNGVDTVDVTGSGRRVAPFGGLKVWRAATAPRTLRLRTSASRGQFSEQVDFQGQDLGGLQVRDNGSLVTVQWRSGLLDQVRATLESVQDILATLHGTGRSPGTGRVLTDKVLYESQAPDGQTLYRMAGADAPWLSITGNEPPAGEGLVFRAGAPNADGSGPVFLYGKLVHGPHQRGGWLDVAPATADQRAVIKTGSPPPDPGDPFVRVTTPEGKITTTVYRQNGHLLVRADDPILGSHGTLEGAAMLRDFLRIDAAMRDAAAASDGFLRAVVLDGDGVALAGPSTVTLVASDHPWAATVEEAALARPSQTPLILIKERQALLVDKDSLTPVGSPRGRSMSLADAVRMPGTMYFNYEAFRSTLTFEDGPVILTTLPLDTKVTVQAFAAPSGHLRPDVLVHHGANWFRASTVTTPSPSPAPTPTPSQAVEAPTPGGTILLVCPAGASNVAGCA